MAKFVVLCEWAQYVQLMTASFLGDTTGICKGNVY